MTEEIQIKDWRTKITKKFISFNLIGVLRIRQSRDDLIEQRQLGDKGSCDEVVSEAQLDSAF